MRYSPLTASTACAWATESTPELELCDKMTAGEDYTDTKSLYFKNDDGTFKHNPIAPLFADLDRIPIPDFDLFDFDNLESSKVGTAIVVVSRGCFYNCTYCGNGNFRKVYPNKKIYARFRSPGKRHTLPEDPAREAPVYQVHQLPRRDLQYVPGLVRQVH